MDQGGAGHEGGVKGGALTLEQVYAEHHDFVWRSVQRLGIPSAIADDAVHDVFLVVARRLVEFEGRSSIRTWLFAIAIRVAQRHRRTRARQARKEEALKGATIDAIAPSGEERRAAADLVHRLLATLPEDRRAVFILIELEGLTAPEVAEAFALKLPTVYSKLRAARIALEAAIAREEATARREVG
jgi:RNA polymerase sigma-70 factor, ECF subfamily